MRKTDQNIGMLDTERAGKLWLGTETENEGIGKAIGNLQTDTEQHGENEKQRHLLLLEKGEGFQAEGINNGFLLTAYAHRAMRQRESVEKKDHAAHTRSDKLILVTLIPHQIDKPHA